MIKKILQIAIGPVPENIQVLMDKWRAYASAHDIEYVLLTDVPELYKDCMPRVVSNYMRVDYLINNPDTLYIDWDIEPLEGFQLPTVYMLDKNNFDSFLFLPEYFLKEIDLGKIEENTYNATNLYYSMGDVYKKYTSIPLIKNKIQHIKGV